MQPLFDKTVETVVQSPIRLQEVLDEMQMASLGSLVASWHREDSSGTSAGFLFREDALASIYDYFSVQKRENRTYITHESFLEYPAHIFLRAVPWEMA